MSLRLAIYNTLKTSTLIDAVYNGESRVMSPEASAVPYVVLFESASFQSNKGLDRAGDYIFRVEVHVQAGEMDLGDQYLQSLSELFSGVISVTYGAPPVTKRYFIEPAELSSWRLEELDKTISRTRTLVIPAWG